MHDAWRYFNWPAGLWEYADDLINLPYPNDLHGAVAQYLRTEESACTPVKKSPGAIVNIRRRGRRPHGADVHRLLQETNGSSIVYSVHENIDSLAKNENPVAAVSREDGYTHLVRSRGVQLSRIADDYTSPIKGPDGPKASTVFTQLEPKMVRIPECNPSSSRPRRWLAGAPGGWWPSNFESDSSDEESDTQTVLKLPFKKRRIVLDTDSADESADDTVNHEPQPYLPRQGRPGPRRVLPMLSHGSSNEGIHRIPGYEDLERSFGSLSTTAIASSDEATEEDERPTSSTSSSAYGSASDEGATAIAAAPEVRGPSHVSPTASFKEGVTPTTRQRRSRRERAARDARWRDSVTPRPTADNDIDSAAPCVQNDDCSEVESSIAVPLTNCANEREEVVIDSDSFADETVVEIIVLSSDSEVDDDMKPPKFEVSIYRSLCASFENTRHPFDGAALVKYVNAEVKRKRESIRVAEYREKKAAQQRQKDALPEAAAGPSTQPESSKRKRAASAQPRKKRATMVQQELSQRLPIPVPVDAASQEAAGSPPASNGGADASPTNAHEQQVSGAPTSNATADAPMLQFEAELTHAATSTPFACATTTNGATDAAWSWIITPAAIGESAHMDLSGFLESLAPMSSPMAVPQPTAVEQHPARLPPLDLVDLDDAINESLKVPPTPQTPEHLRGTEPLDDAATRLQVEMLSPAAGATQPSIRMRIVRLPIDEVSATSQPDDDEE
ncbi:hypothetical protein QAD02_008648 [Eretmocerus hayati]|uniref:Uncharacterized protein n=1 Tax=Eretmocerus hayati TaxID=131215 RepID=A0ACC2N8E9_9HYME|nr:hypothetical protein QAD02_008648 [Eretmocerus hayati]